MIRNFMLLSLLFLAACTSVPNVQTDASGFQDLTPAEAKELLAQKEELGLFVLNTHTPYEGAIENTDAVIEDWENIANHLDQLPADKNTPILAYCRSGRMSLAAIEQLKSLGYTNLYNLKGGMIAWDKAGYQVFNKTFE
ncbi:MAG: rhodanese-like domain-containing protein [Nanoarchaeota archaeon]